MDMRSLLAQAKKQLAEITGLKPVTVTRVSHDEQGWRVGVEVLALARIPPASDLLAEYELLLNGDGGVIRVERKRTRLRGDVGEALEPA